jgi:hypothetical protein
MKKVFLLVMLCALALTAKAQQTVIGTPYASQSVPYNTWTNITFPTQTANFEIQFDAVPSVSASDYVMALSATAAEAYPNTAVPVRFYTDGSVGAMNATAYSSVTATTYTGGAKVHWTLAVNLTAKTYNAYIGTVTRTTIAANYAFRTGATATSLGYLTIYQDPTGPSATNTISNVTVLTYPGAAVKHQVSMSWNASTGATGYNALRSTTSGGPYTALNTTPIKTTTYEDTTVTSGATYYYVVNAVAGSSKPSANSNQASVVIPSP